MSIIKLTKSVVDAFPYASDKQIVCWDTELRGFGLLVGKTTKAYIAQKDIAGKTRRVNIGRHGTWTTDEARKEARQLLAVMDRGDDPKKLKHAEQQQRLTLEQAYEVHVQLLRRKEASEASIASYELTLRTYLKDWKKRPLHEITRTEARELHQQLSDKHGTYAANRAMKCFRAIFNTALKEHDYLPICPTIAVHWNKEHRRQEPIPVDQLKTWLAEVNSIRNHVRRDYQLFVLFTGLRKTDAATIRWEDVNLADISLHRPKPKGGKDRAFTMPLPFICVEILRRRQKQNTIDYGPDCPWVFPTFSRSGEVIAIREPKEPRRKMQTPHRLRDTYTTAANSAGLSPYDIDVLTNHRPPKGSVTAGYIRQDFEYLLTQQRKIELYLMEKLGMVNSALSVVV